MVLELLGEEGTCARLMLRARHGPERVGRRGGSCSVVLGRGGAPRGVEWCVVDTL